MTKFKETFRVESTRLKEWDYSNPWWYYVTINTKNHIHYFGKIVNEEIVLNEIGIHARKTWEEIPNHFQNIELDYFVIMPNHIHGIIIINKNSKDVACNVSTNKYSQISPKGNSLSVIVRSYKSAVAKFAHENGLMSFSWQERFYDRIIRNEKELYNIRKYIEQNPLKWELEKDNHENICDGM